jgi:membrane-associated phospholipid phosphatase
MPLKIDKWIEENLSNKTPHLSEVDDLLKWTPFTSVFILDLLGGKSKNNWKKHILLFACCEAILSVVSNSLKKLVHEHRPEPTMRHDSFPSGHADTAFAGAEIFRMEFKDQYPVLSYSGYAVAASVATMRLYKDKHWMTDLIGGALLGFACTKLAYWLCKGNKKKTTEEKRDTAHVDETGQLQLDFVKA